MKLFGSFPKGLQVQPIEQIDPALIMTAIEGSSARLEAALEDWMNRHNVSEAARDDFVASFTGVMLATLEEAGVVVPREKV